MKLLRYDFKKGFAKVQPESPEDLWTIHTILVPEDHVKGSTERKIKLQDKTGENTKVIKKKITLAVAVEKSLLTEGDSLRVSGTIVDGPEDIPRGSYHTITVHQQDMITITKKSWLGFYIDKLKESTKNQKEKVLLFVFDREEAYGYRLKQGNTEQLVHIKGQVQKKQLQEGKGNFFKELAEVIKTQSEQEKAQHLVVASPSFWNEYLKKELDDALSKKIVFATCSTVSSQAIQELLKRPELKKVLAQERSAQEAVLMDYLMTAIAKDSGFYGKKHSTEAVTTGNARSLYVSEHFLRSAIEDKTYGTLEGLMKTAEQTQAEVHIITAKETTKKLDALGGIAGIQRWQTQ